MRQIHKADTSLGTEPISKLLLQHSVPAALGILVISVYSLVDTLFIGRYVGSTGLAAATIVAPITFLVSSIGFGLGMGGASLISLLLGKNQEREANRVFGNQVFLCWIIGAILLGGGYLFQNELLTLFGAEEHTLGPSRDYFFYILLGLPLYLGQIMLLNVLRSEGTPIAAMLVLGIPALLNIGLDAVFIAGWDMGLIGAGMATAISQGIGLLIGIGFIVFGGGRIHPNIGDHRPDWSLIRQIGGLGSVQLFSQGAFSLTIILANNLLMHYGGEVAVSVYGLMIRIMMFSFFPVIGIVQGFMPIAGYNHGAEQHERVRKVIRLSFRASVVIALLISAVMVLFGGPVIHLFTEEKELIELGQKVLIFAFSAFPLLGIQLISTGYFQAIGQAKPALWLTLAKQAIIVPLVLFLAWKFGLDGIWYTFPVSEILTTVLAYYFFKRELARQQGPLQTA